jgi:hypothetical protein
MHYLGLVNSNASLLQVHERSNASLLHGRNNASLLHGRNNASFPVLRNYKISYSMANLNLLA